MTREQKYADQMEQLGIWDEAFAPEVKILAMMERELQRFTKEWKNAGADPESVLWEEIKSQRRDILARKEALGLTPKALKRIKGAEWTEQAKNQPEKLKTALELIQERRRREA